MRIQHLMTGAYGVNTYILNCPRTKLAAVIDPGDGAQEILDLLAEQGLSLQYILLTHGHFDHIGAVEAIARQTGAKVCIHREDAAHLQDPWLNLSVISGQPFQVMPADILLEDGQQVSFGEITLDVLFTPGHTPGGVCYAREEDIFSGDTLFYHSIGRTDFPRGDQAQLIESIQKRLFSLEGDYTVFPGHGNTTSLDEERVHNPYVPWDADKCE